MSILFFPFFSSFTELLTPQCKTSSFFFPLLFLFRSLPLLHLYMCMKDWVYWTYFLESVLCIVFHHSIHGFFLASCCSCFKVIPHSSFPNDVYFLFHWYFLFTVLLNDVHTFFHVQTVVVLHTFIIFNQGDLSVASKGWVPCVSESQLFFKMYKHSMHIYLFIY